MNRRIKLCIVNRNYPPTKGATGYYAHQLAKYLEATNKYQIHIVTTGREKGGSRRHYVRGLYHGKAKLLRLLSAIFESYQLIKRALKEDADFYIILTDPSFLNFWASKLLRGKKWALWSMDLYPEAFVANKLISKQNRLVQYLQEVLKQNPPNYLIALGPNQRDYLLANYYPSLTSTVTPVGLLEEKAEIIRHADNGPDWYKKGAIIFGYVGTIGEAHASNAIVRLIKSISSAGHRCVLSCSGSKSLDVLNQVRDLENVFVADYLDQKLLAFIDIQIVALLSDWTHICVPSKALSAVQHGSAVFFIGKEESDTWIYIQEAGWRVSPDYDSSEILHNLDSETLNEKKSAAIVIANNLKQKLGLSYLAVDETIQKII